jgi:hypothetical protein
MSKTPIAFLLLKRVGTYLEQAEAKGQKQKKDLQVARRAFNDYWKMYYGEPVLACTGSKPRSSGGLNG